MAAVAHARGGVAAAEEGRVQQQREAAAAAAAAAEEEGRVQQQQREAVVAAAAAAEEGRVWTVAILLQGATATRGWQPRTRTVHHAWPARRGHQRLAQQPAQMGMAVDACASAAVVAAAAAATGAAALDKGQQREKGQGGHDRYHEGPGAER